MGTAWVTGADGFLGRHVVTELRLRNWRVDCIDRRRGKELSEDNLMELEQWPDAVVHLAGNSLISRSITHPGEDYRDSVSATELLCKFLQDMGSGARVVFTSSAAVYGESKSTEEAQPLRPVSPYGEHKAICERVLVQSGLAVNIVRPFSVYGPGLLKQLPYELANRVLTGESPIVLGGSGQEVRDFTYVFDLVKIICDIATGKKYAPPVMNIGTGVPTSVREFAEVMVNVLERGTHIKFDGIKRKGNPARMCANVERMRNHEFITKTPLWAGLNFYAQWLRARDDRSAISA